MKLRELYFADAPLMLEWMKDPECNKYFRFDPDKVTLESVHDFIEKARHGTVDRHYAITDGSDEYLGTVSLKSIDKKDRCAEYAIALRASASGKGLGYKATLAILDIAFSYLKLNRVYLNVLSDNKKAIALYLKCGFKLEGEFRQHVFVRDGYKNLQWYGLLRGELKVEREERKVEGESKRELSY